jgi:hypothetical protein
MMSSRENRRDPHSSPVASHESADANVGWGMRRSP